MDLLGLIGQLVVDTSASWIRMFIALGISIVISFVVGVLAATSRTAEKVILPVVDVLQTLPILAFFPFAIYIFVGILPGFIGINAAVIFLIITSMIWNIIFGVYESIKTLPNEIFEVVDLYHFDFWTRVKKIYIPASFPRIVEQSILSWSIGLFYLVTSEIFSTGSQNYKVTYGIGSALVTLASQGLDSYLLGIAVFIFFVIATRFLFFRPLEDYSTRYTRPQARLARPVWLQKTLKFIKGGLNAKYVKEIHVATKKIKIGNAREVREAMLIVDRGAKSRIYLAILVLLIGLGLYFFISNPTLMSDETVVLPALAFSFARVWLAFIVITIIAVPVCVYLVFISKKSSRYITLFQVLASIPATILLPLIVLGLKGAPFQGELVAFIIFVLSGIWYMIFSIVASTKTLPNNIFEVKRLFGLKGIVAWKEIYLWAILPGFITGALTGIAAEWNASIVAEYFTTSGITGSSVISSVNVGIGKLLDLALSSGGGGLLLMMVALLNLVVMILLINTFVWKRAYKNVSKIYG